ncbi:hypothetical protein CSPAE12_07487 [Colletotrichum incanum]|nr:hypothetical protein CSPAE12_07487 [Colletotrichum incanum]
MLDGYECNQGEKMRGPSMDIDEKSTAFSQAQISTPRRFSWLPRSATPSLRSPTFRRRAASPFDDDDYSYSESNPFGEDFREQNEDAERDWDHDHDHDHGDNPFEDCEYELPPAAAKREGTWTKFKKAMSPKRAISKWKYRKVKHNGLQADDPDHGDRGDPHGHAS